MQEDCVRYLREYSRGLRSIIESVLMKTMYTVPSDGSIAKVTITAESVEGTSQPILMNRRNKIVDFADIA